MLEGKSEEESFKLAQAAIMIALKEYKPVKSFQQGAEDAAKFIDSWVEGENQKNHMFSTELEINDYPMIARNKVTMNVYH